MDDLFFSPRFVFFFSVFSNVCTMFVYQNVLEKYTTDDVISYVRRRIRVCTRHPITPQPVRLHAGFGFRRSRNTNIVCVGIFPDGHFYPPSYHYILNLYLNHYKRVFGILDDNTHTGPDCCSGKNNLYFHVSWLITLSVLIFFLTIIREIICFFFPSS